MIYLEARTRVPGGFAPISDSSVIQITFEDRPDPLALASYKDSTFEIPCCLVSFMDEPIYTKLPSLKKKVVIVDFGRWKNSRDAASFIRPWLDRISWDKPTRIIASWSVLNQDEKSFLINLLEEENGRRTLDQFGPQSLDVSYGRRGDLGDWRTLPRPTRSIA